MNFYLTSSIKVRVVEGLMSITACLALSKLLLCPPYNTNRMISIVHIELQVGGKLERHVGWWQVDITRFVIEVGDMGPEW